MSDGTLIRNIGAATEYAPSTKVLKFSQGQIRQMLEMLNIVISGPSSYTSAEFQCHKVLDHLEPSKLVTIF